MNEILEKISYCIERGKSDKHAKFPPDLKDQDGVVEYTQAALDNGISAQSVLNDGMMPGMNKIGIRFRNGEIYVPDVLIAAKAMKAGMQLIKPFFQSGEAKHKGKIVLGTVAGDLHDIGKNLVAMVMEGGGWEVVDIGVDANAQKFIEAIENNDAKVVGLSALLTTTMNNMEAITKEIKSKFPEVTVVIGGAPVTEKFSNSIGSDFYSADPQGALDFLNEKLEI